MHRLLCVSEGYVKKKCMWRMGKVKRDILIVIYFYISRFCTREVFILLLIYLWSAEVHTIKDWDTFSHNGLCYSEVSCAQNKFFVQCLFHNEWPIFINISFKCQGLIVGHYWVKSSRVNESYAQMVVRKIFLHKNGFQIMVTVISNFFL